MNKKAIAQIMIILIIIFLGVAYYTFHLNTITGSFAECKPSLDTGIDFACQGDVLFGCEDPDEGWIKFADCSSVGLQCSLTGCI